MCEEFSLRIYANDKKKEKKYLIPTVIQWDNYYKSLFIAQENSDDCLLTIEIVYVSNNEKIS